MIKLVFCLRRRADLSREEFHRYWLDTHGPLARGFAEQLGIRRYVQLHTLDTPMNDVLRESRDAPEPYDGIAELWFDSLEEMAAITGSPEGRAAGRVLLEDERRFIDLERSPLWLADEHEMVPPRR